MEDNITYQELCRLKKKTLTIRDDIIKKRNMRLFSIKDLNLDEIIEKFSFRHMQAENTDSCCMFANNKVCHSMNIDELNCFGCYCPNYDLEIAYDKSVELYKLGKCNINSKFGIYKQTGTKSDLPKEYLVPNCSNCTIPHNKTFLKKIIEQDLKIFLGQK